MKKVEYPEQFTLASIKYRNGCKGYGYAPNYKVEVGDEVITGFDEGCVESIVTYCTPEDDYFKMIAEINTVDRITHKIVEIEYKKKKIEEKKEGENNDLSEG